MKSLEIINLVASVLIDDEYIAFVANDDDEAEIKLTNDTKVTKLRFIEAPDERVGRSRVVLVFQRSFFQQLGIHQGFLLPLER